MTNEVTSALEQWANRTPERQRAFAQEGLLAQATEAIWCVMDAEGVRKVDLAQRIGCSKAHISMVLEGTRNMTLRTLSDIAAALGYEVEVKLVRKLAIVPESSDEPKDNPG